MAQKDNPFYIVGIGASAGGLIALQQFFDNMPADSGMAFVVIQHLSPDFKSQMDDLLRSHTTMEVQQVADKIILEPNNIYLNVSMTQMGIKDGTIVVTEITKKKHVDLPIDVFFRSLAEHVGPQAIGLILSGTGKDGSEGIRAIHAAGGIVIAQSPESAQFDAMPQKAIETGLCDFILPPDQIATILLEHAASPEEPSAIAPDGLKSPETEADFAGIFHLLQRAYQLDFSKYKMGTVGRRIRRRMGYRRMEAVSEYLEVLSHDENELDDLYHDLLIGVTEFFRDDQAFQFLKTAVIPELFAAVAPGQDLRAWSAGCATGEEAYSLAILLAEKAQELQFTGKISIFATDVHKRTLEVAAQGVFTRDRLSKVSSERLERFFIQLDPNLFKVKTELRKLLTFAHHDLTRDIPFSKLDLVCCRNLLIYLQPEVQKKVLSRFCFALKMNGVLFLGKSEGIGQFSGEFETVSAQSKIFRKIRERKFPVDREAAGTGQPRAIARTEVRPVLQQATLDRRILNDYDTLMEKHIPPGVLVDENFHIIHCFGNVSQFLKDLKGRFEPDILSMTEDNVHIALSTSLQKTRKTGQSVVTRKIRIKCAEEECLVDLTVDPIPFEHTGSLHYHIFFKLIKNEPLPPPEMPKETDLNAFEPSLFYRQRLADLEFELQGTRADLLATQENLQATSEALNTTNEELYSINAEFEHSNLELKQLNVDLINLLTSIDSGIIFLDQQMRIRKFNPAISAFFKLLPQDIGRPINHIAYQLDNQNELLEDIRSVLTDGIVIEKEVTTRDGNWLLSRIMPYRSEEGPKEGVAITFTDISKVKETEVKVIRLNEEMAERVKELEETYLSLEAETRERILAMEELREKDQLMIQQSRMAAMGEMLGNIAHQWRQPLNVLALQVQELRMSYKLGKFTEDMLDKGVAKAMEVIQHMSRTIDDFRDFLALDKEKKLFKVDQVIRKAVSLIDASLKEHNISLEISSTGEPEIHGYPNEYGQVILNIVMNAKDVFAETGRSEGRIMVHSWTENGKSVVTITDNAGGIKEEIIGKIFDAYFTTKALGKGTGVGLFMSNNIIEKSMGGRLSARNVEGGAEFRIEV